MPLQATAGAATYDAFGGGAAAVNYIEDVFSTYLYTGNGSTQTITNGIDLSTKGGLVWMKGRSGATDHALYDTARGTTKDLVSNSSVGETTQSTGLTAFGTTGFTIGALAKLNTSSATYVSWTFRKQPKFFDVVTWTGDGGTGTRTISHALGSVPGCVIGKSTSTSGAWYVQHRSIAATSILQLNTTDPVNTDSAFNNQYADSTSIYLNKASGLNSTGISYVAYLFAHNAGGFGNSGTDNVISCGSFTTDASRACSVTLGYEPQYLLLKRTSGAEDWYVFDQMRGWTTSSEQILKPNLADAEITDAGVVGRFTPTATGFSGTGLLSISSTYIYIAIRRGPMRTPTTGTSVYLPSTANAGVVTTGFPVDSQWEGYTPGASGRPLTTDRLRGTSTTDTSVNGPTLTTSSTAAENATGAANQAWNNTGFTAARGSSHVYWNFRRAPGFFDVVCYTGTGSATTFSHNLGVVPEMMIVKRRDTSADWWVYDTATGNTKYQVLNSTATPTTSSTPWNNTTPTSSVFSVGTGTPVNASGGTYVAYLFATAPGVSKVGSYTGTGTTLQVNCGFTGGARFVLIKRTDSTGDWYVWDSARGIVAGNDPYLVLNSTAAEVTNTDYVDTFSSGFEISSTAPAAINANGGTFIFLAIA
jgi:hypothetical protein